MVKTKNTSLIMPEKLKEQLTIILSLTETYYNQSEFIKIAIQEKIERELQWLEQNQLITKISQLKEKIEELNTELNRRY